MAGSPEVTPLGGGTTSTGPCVCFHCQRVMAPKASAPDLFICRYCRATNYKLTFEHTAWILSWKDEPLVAPNPTSGIAVVKNDPVMYWDPSGLPTEGLHMLDVAPLDEGTLEAVPEELETFTDEEKEMLTDEEDATQGDEP